MRSIIPRPYFNLVINHRKDDEDDSAVIREMFMENVYRIEGYKLEQDKSVVIDVGANIGLFTLLVLKIAQENNKVITVYAIEPEEENLKLLKKNIDENPLLFNDGSEVIIVEKGMSDFSGKAKITHQSGSSRISKQGKQEIDVITYDEFIEMCEIDKVDFLKIDIEGSEVPMISGASQENINNVHFCVIEFDEDNEPEYLFDALRPFLSKFSFSTWGVPSNGCNIYFENHSWNKDD